MLALYFENAEEAKKRAQVREEFVRALAEFPNWAVQRAFDSWVRTRTRRPSPAEIAILAHQEIEPYCEELARRDRIKALEAEEARSAQRVSAEAAARIMAASGFTEERTVVVNRAREARTLEQAEEMAARPPKPHWTETADPNGPEMAALRAARANNERITPKKP